jgi:hypothetical protein
MSIYLEFPSINDYPTYPNAGYVAEKIQYSDEEVLLQTKQEQQILQNDWYCGWDNHR